MKVSLWQLWIFFFVKEIVQDFYSCITLKICSLSENASFENNQNILQVPNKKCKFAIGVKWKSVVEAD